MILQSLFSFYTDFEHFIVLALDLFYKAARYIGGSNKTNAIQLYHHTLLPCHPRHFSDNSFKIAFYHLYPIPILVMALLRSNHAYMFIVNTR